MGSGKGLNNVFECTHVVEQLSFSMFISILTFDFDLILKFINCAAKGTVYQAVCKSCPKRLDQMQERGVFTSVKVPDH